MFKVVAYLLIMRFYIWLVAAVTGRGAVRWSVESMMFVDFIALVKISLAKRVALSRSVQGL